MMFGTGDDGWYPSYATAWFVTAAQGKCRRRRHLLRLDGDLERRESLVTRIARAWAKRAATRDLPAMAR